jgi:hypothetical protein
VKELSTVRSIIFLILGFSILTSCNENDDNPPSGNSFPVTMTFSGVTDTEFRMWTNGNEVDTDNLNVQDFMDAEDWEFLRPEYYADANATFSFDEDSIFSTDPINGLTGYPYEFRNDSLFITNQFIFDGDTTQFEQYLAIGNLNQIVLNQGYYEIYISGNNFSTRESKLDQFLYDTEAVGEDYGQGDIATALGINDTLFIYNQRIIFN